jgi:hypothetical protein
MIASNKDWTAPVYIDDRRFFVLNVNDSKIGDRAYWNALRDEQKHDDVAILYRTHGDTELTQPTRCVR